MKHPPLSEQIGVVVIGRNEGQRLVRCLQSLRASGGELPIVYVDSNSTDDSVEFARSIGAGVVELDLSKKFTAARARNSGLWSLLESHPNLNFVQFVDGDCELDTDWLKTAFTYLQEHPEFAVVCGRRRERFPERSPYNRLCDLEWNTPVGEANACGGDALMRVSALKEVEGYRESLIAGEEPEMCFRMRCVGHKIARIDAEMTLHDAAMTKASQWFKRAKRSGHAFAETAALHGAHPEKPCVRQTKSNLFWGVGVPVATVGATAVLGPLGLLGGAAAFSKLYFSSYNYEKKNRSEDDARFFARACVAGKIPEAWGALTYFANRARGRQSTLIEYKGPEPAGAGADT